MSLLTPMASVKRFPFFIVLFLFILPITLFFKMYSNSSSSGCINDFQCGVGYKCVKAQYSVSGSCMKAVNSMGVQQYKLPSLNSVNPNYSKQCTFSTNCPIGFFCVNGNCVR